MRQLTDWHKRLLQGCETLRGGLAASREPRREGATPRGHSCLGCRREPAAAVAMPVGLPGDSLPVHFIFGLSDDPHERRFGFSHYLAVRAASIHLRPACLRRPPSVCLCNPLHEYRDYSSK